jgi:dolichyl-phosphate-mannose--protein O-mannosyl transferase
VTTRGTLARLSGTPAPAPGLRPPLRERLVPPLPSGLWAWLGPLLVTAFAGGLRFWRLGEPRAIVFDETYYAKDAYALLRFGYERSYVDGADSRLLAGQTDLFTTTPSFVVHPPVGKWVIALGEWWQGLTPFGWRFSVAVVGTLSVFVMCRVALRLTRSIVLGCVAGLLLALDGLHFVMSRTALLDGILAFFVLAAFGCLLVDRDRTRARLLSRVTPRRTSALRRGPRLGARPWRLAAGICLGLAIATKWSALPYVVAFGLLVLFWDAGARRAVGVERPYLVTLTRSVLPTAVAFILVPAAVYLMSWAGWFLTDGGWARDWAQTRPGTTWVPEALRSLWHYHAEMFRFHTNLHEKHPYQSSPWGWFVLARPVSYYYRQLESGELDCHAQSCVREVLGVGTPALWWASVAAVAFLLWRWAGARDWRAGAVLAGVAAGWLPWLRYQDRPIFFFYAVVFVPFLVLAVTLTLGAVIGDPRASPRRRAWGAAAAGAVVLLVAVNFLWLYPLLSAETLPRPEWLRRMWLRSWI